MKLKTVRLEDIRPYENNPRRNDGAVDAVAESIRQCGYVAPIVVDDEMVILAGHTRYKALAKLGHTTAKVLIAEGLSEEQKRKYRILDNKTGEIAEWDEDLLNIELEGLDFDGFDFGLLDQIVPPEKPQPEPEAVEDDYDEAPPDVPKAKRGEVYQLGRHRLMCGDSTNAKDIDALLDGDFMRMTVTSPPYGVGKDYEEKGIEPWRKTISGVINSIKGKTLIICWNIVDLFSTGTQFTEPTGAYSIQMMSDAGYGMLYNRIWKKPGANFAGNNPYYTVTTKPAQDYEYLYAFAEKNADHRLKSLKTYLFGEAKKANLNNDIVKSIGGPGYMCGHWFTNHQFALIDEKNYALIQDYCKSQGINAFMRDYADIKNEYLENTIFSHNLSDDDFSNWGVFGVWEFNTVHERLGGHAAAYPVELPTRFIKMHSYDGDSVLDPFGGTGTTLIACEQLNRKCYMMELDPKYVDVIIDRWERMTGEKAVRIDGV